MEKNLPVDFEMADKAYNDHVIPFLSKLDAGEVFKKFINTILKIAMYGFLVYGVYLSIIGLFGDDGFFESLGDGWQKGYGGYLGGIVGALLSVVVSWVGYSMLKKRIEQLNQQSFESLLNYIYKHFLPRLIIIIGEILFLLILSVGIFQIIATLLGTTVFAPLAEMIPMLLEGNPYADMIGIPVCIGDYEDFVNSITPGVMAIITSFVVLMAYYISVEAYKYLIKLIINVINFLPKFAIPLAIRSKSGN